jgi:hypothetical protein
MINQRGNWIILDREGDFLITLRSDYVLLYRAGVLRNLEG